MKTVSPMGSIGSIEWTRDAGGSTPSVDGQNSKLFDRRLEFGATSRRLESVACEPVEICFYFERMPELRVQFIHGLEGSPHGNKARLLAQHFEARTPAMDTSDFESCVALQSEVARAFEPRVLVGSSFGGAVAVALLSRGLWSGPTLLLAQAALRYDPEARLPRDATIWLVHGRSDTVIDPDDSRRLAATGDPRRVKLIEVDDDHPLHASTASGLLVDWVERLGATGGDVQGKDLQKNS
jgi:predicted esterase